MLARGMARALSATSADTADVDAGFEHAHGLEVEFDDVVMSFLFLIAVWVGGKAAAGMRMPSLVGELAVGLVMGPPLLDVVPLAEALMLYGEVGLLLLVRRCRPSAVRRSQWTPGIGIQKAAAASSELLSTRSAQRALRHSHRRNLMRLRMPAQVLEAGLDADLPMMRTVGPRGVAIALLDPLASLAAGCTLAPSSIGIALNVLRAADALNTPVGQLIIASAVLDDVIALLLLTLLQALGSDASPASMVAPAVASVGLMAAAVVIAKHGTPRLVRLAERVAPAQLRSGGRAAEERALLLLLLLVTAVFVPLARAFAPLESWRAFETYAATCHVKRLQSWLVKLFFAATCGFIVPLASGLLVVPASRANVLTVGLTMAAWGEFAFIVATASLNSGLLDQTTFAALLLAVLASVVIAPVLARAALRGSQRRKERAILDAIKGGRRAGARAGPVVDVSTAPVFFRLRTSAPPAWGLSVRLMDLIRQHGLEARVLDFRSHQYASAILFEVHLKDADLRAPPTRALSADDEAVVRRRQSDLLAIFSPLCGGGGSCVLERWLPGEALASRLPRAGVEPAQSHLAQALEGEEDTDFAESSYKCAARSASRDAFSLTGAGTRLGAFCGGGGGMGPPSPRIAAPAFARGGGGDRGVDAVMPSSPRPPELHTELTGEPLVRPSRRGDSLPSPDERQFV
ncbi:hypothetical protein EMIHUDRAFT_225735 [Emiliania huxleyi CCMP1516]|uniref:Cation/H+ exchanger transmembrane domain-containing protein n=2 Tax=Emiliania huxleyi TaxID=2903 RepID=A0A0D3KNE8_EMIH1|nr:hypothetical protein EMIHUDRAFT_225735 [Emiliania huxleyi CCMP1516]EOD37283.1 hypothetical protein EMIHUDRAFT_225735 [Emiliania huxleyi CCMP1516]|eukprot:XP_005789712.1 hypothetical protein EMIHUDRAFT_225735 [Emiliania huxleyi CCMP1516]